MTHAEFDHLTQGLHARSVAGCRLVLVDGLSINAAARQLGIDPGNVSRMLRKIPREICRCCGQAVKNGQTEESSCANGHDWQEILTIELGRHEYCRRAGCGITRGSP